MTCFCKVAYFDTHHSSSTFLTLTFSTKPWPCWYCHNSITRCKENGYKSDLYMELITFKSAMQSQPLSVIFMAVFKFKLGRSRPISEWVSSQQRIYFGHTYPGVLQRCIPDHHNKRGGSQPTLVHPNIHSTLLPFPS